MKHCCSLGLLLEFYTLLLLLLKSVEFDDDVALLLSVAGLVVGPYVAWESEIRSTDSAALRTSWTCLRLCGSCVTSCTSFFRGSDPAIYGAPETSITDSSPYIRVACRTSRSLGLLLYLKRFALMWSINRVFGRPTERCPTVSSP